jgi:Flp pilus assembly protein CpaB
MDLRRRPPRSTIVFALASVACALGAFSLMRGYAARLEALRPAVGPVVPVVVAADDVERGATLFSDDVEVIELPETVAPAAALREPTDAVGRTTLTAMAPGEAVTPTRLVGGTGGELAALVPPGLRAVPIVVSTVPGGLVAGDRIDVLATYGEGRMYAETVGRELELLVTPGADDGGASTAAGGSGGTELVVLADTATATRLARSAVASVLSIAVVGVADG